MADRIRVNTSGLLRTKENVSSQIESIRARTAVLTAAVNELNGMWEGSGHDVYDAKFKADIRYLELLLGRLDGIIACEANAEKEYSACENKIASIISSFNAG